MTDSYTPSKIILEKYADVLVNFALNSGKGVNSGEVVEVNVPDIAKPIAKALQLSLLKAGAHPIIRLIPTGNFNQDFFQFASEKQLAYFPKKYLEEKARLLDHVISIIADTEPEELKNVDSKVIMKSAQAKYPYREWLFEKERRNKFSWTLGLYGTEAKAKIVGLSIEEYWNQIIKACFLDKKDPINSWKSHSKLQVEIKNKLNEMKIETLNIVGADINLNVQIGETRSWKTGSGANIPSFEHFTSPNWRGTEGWVKFNQPLYRYGNVIDGIEIEFKNGLVSKSSAKRGQQVLKNMIATKNANKIGEFSLTDKRLSRITHPMAETLYDENIGGPFGNTHIALGMAYKNCFNGDASKISEKQWEEMGYNNSSVHTDIVSTTDRTVTATLSDGTKIVIYKDGQFVI